MSAYRSQLRLSFVRFGAIDSEENPIDPALARELALNICKRIISLVESIEGRTSGVAASGVPTDVILQWKSIVAVGRSSAASLVRQIDDGRFKTSYAYRVAWMNRATAAVTALGKANTKDSTTLGLVKGVVSSAANEIAENLKDAAKKITTSQLDILWAAVKPVLTHPVSYVALAGVGLWYFGPALGILAKRKALKSAS